MSQEDAYALDKLWNQKHKELYEAVREKGETDMRVARLIAEVDALGHVLDAIKRLPK